mgnify:CR=1 FL=1
MNGKTIMYLLKRFGMAILTIFMVVTITFWFMQLIPGGPFTSERGVSDVTLAALKAKYGLDKPLFVQYLKVPICTRGNDKSALIVVFLV